MLFFTMKKHSSSSFVIFLIFIKCCLSQTSLTLPYKDTSVTFNLTTLQRQVFKNVPVWTIESGSDNNLKYNDEGIANPDGTIFEDTSLKAILLKKNNCNENCWEGVYGLGTTRKVINSHSKSKRNGPTVPKYGGTYVSHPINISRVFHKLIKSNHDSDKFYAKLVIVIDDTLFKKLGSDISRTSKYMNIFWSTVDLQYKNITLPQIEIRITGLIIAKDDKALNCVNEFSTDKVNVNIDSVLYKCKDEKSFIKNTNIDNYDAMIVMTGLSGYIDLYGQRTGSNGAGFNASICSNEYNLSVVTDDGIYFGIHSAIHELGHLFGLDHDALPGNSFECFPTDRKSLTVMWPKNEDREIEFWSECSLRALKIFTESNEESWCLRETVHRQT